MVNNRLQGFKFYTSSYQTLAEFANVINDNVELGYTAVFPEYETKIIGGCEVSILRSITLIKKI